MIRFSTIAANADILGEDTPMAEPPPTPGRRPPGAAGGTRGERGRARREPQGGRETGAARPGADINAPGFVKDRDATKPS